jgi:hypothetical protein
MSKSAKTVVGFTLLGLAVAALCYLHAVLLDYTKPMNWLDTIIVPISVILCPAQLIFAGCIDCEATGWDGFIMYSIIGTLNAVIYMLVGFLLVALRKGPGFPTRSPGPPSSAPENKA